MAATGTPTANIGLRIPLGTDPASVDDINYNSNLLDTKLGAVGSDSVQDQIDALNSKIKILYSKTYTVRFDAYEAGTIGTRGAQKTVNLSSDISTYGDVVSVFISWIDNSNVANYQAFVSGNTLYVNAYRAVAEGTAAYSVRVKVTFAKQA